MVIHINIPSNALKGLTENQKELIEELMEDNYYVHEDDYFNSFVGKAATKLRSKKPEPYLLTTVDRYSQTKTIAINKKAKIIEEDLNFGFQDMINNFRLWNRKKGML